MVKVIEASLGIGALLVALTTLLRALFLSSFQDRLGGALGLPARLARSQAPALGELVLLLDGALPARLARSHAPALLDGGGGLDVPLALLDAVLLVKGSGVGRALGGELDKTVVGNRGDEAHAVGRATGGGGGGLGLGVGVDGFDSALELPARLAGSRAPGTGSSEASGREGEKSGEFKLHDGKRDVLEVVCWLGVWGRGSGNFEPAKMAKIRGIETWGKEENREQTKRRLGELCLEG